MFFKIVILVSLLNYGVSVLNEEFEDAAASSGNAPFFELPCMVVGGTCARSVACPKGTKVSAKGLCPVQQEHGMECCRPTLVEMRCSSKGGECVSSFFKCPISLRISEATDCAKDQTCCVYVK
ncbi:hypothetical protein B5X24_HaOG209047 [Helicoverpa armigera]|uniref:Uncharacterized protein n=1 Tax=Helicoverpa armigera TaxID=29058 RepID=A0A2W1BEQ4_HELAM|nr:U-scoloptoxin(19)-Sm1a [Helicoverpa armigera]PZC73602.1 hypothetical protein B5X24_HaOG209047 [Helicoverpa armigera]